MNDLVSMVNNGHTSIALARRFAYIEIQNIVITEDGKQTMTPLMHHIFQKYWHPLLAELNRNYATITKNPYYIKSVNVEFNGQIYKERVPIALRLGSFAYSVIMDKDSYEDVHKFIIKGRPNNKQPKIYYTQSSLYPGMMSGDCENMLSEFGVIRKEWKMYQIHNAQNEHMRAKIINAPIYIEHVLNPVTAANDVQTTRMDDHIKTKYDVEGYPQETEIKLDIKEDQNLIVVPDQHRISAHHPSISSNSLTEIDSRKFEGMIDKALGLPFSDYYAGGSVFSTRSQSAIDETRAALSAKLSAVATDYVLAIKEIWKTIYGTEIEVRISHRAHVDTDMIQLLHGIGAIDDDMAKYQLLSIAGINNHHQQNNEKLKKPLYDIQKADGPVMSKGKKQRFEHNLESLDQGQ